MADLFPNDYGKAVKCRGHIAYRERNGKPSWEEWQADTLAAELLMPTFLINAEIERVALTLPNKALCLFQGLNLSKTSGCFYKSLFNSMLLWRFQFEGHLVTQDCKDYKDQFVH